LTFQEFTVQQFKKQEEFNKKIESEIKNIHIRIDNMDKHQPTWFMQ
jgi:hypothetical protein